MPRVRVCQEMMHCPQARCYARAASCQLKRTLAVRSPGRKDGLASFLFRSDTPRAM